MSGYSNVLIDTTNKRNCSKTASMSCKFSKPVASFPSLLKFFEGLVPRLRGSRGLASSQDLASWNSRRGPGIYKIVEKIFNLCMGAPAPEQQKEPRCTW